MHCAAGNFWSDASSREVHIVSNIRMERPRVAVQKLPPDLAPMDASSGAQRHCVGSYNFRRRTCSHGGFRREHRKTFLRTLQQEMREHALNAIALELGTCDAGPVHAVPADCAT